MKIKPFAVEEWMNAWEEGARFNIAETCVDSISLDELFALTGQDRDAFLREFSARRLTYGAIEGAPAFRQGVCRLYKTLAPEHIVPTHGAAGANHHIFYSLLEPGDRVVSIMPTYQQLYSIPESFGADVRLLHLRQENDYLPDLDELRRLGEICLKYGVLIVSDEIHHDFIFPGHRHVVLADLDERFRDITVTCTAPSKTFNIAGLQASNIFIANPRMREAFRKEISKTGYDGLNMMALGACESAYRCGRDWLEELLVYLKGNLDFAREFLDRRVPGVKLVEPEGTYLLWLDCRELGLEHDELEDLMVHKAGLWLDGGQMFGEAGAGFQRVNMACPRAILEAAFEKLAAAVEGLKDRRHT